MKKIFFIIFSILLFSCHNKIENNNSLQSIAIDYAKLDELKNLVLTEYNKNDSIYFTQIENKNFKEFVNNNFDSTDLYFDIIVNGLSIKYFYSYFPSFDFVLIRGINNKYYYLGLSDVKYYEEIIKKLYSNSNTLIYEFNKDTLLIIQDSKRESEILYQIYSNDSIFETKYSVNLTVSELIYYIYKIVDGNNRINGTQYLIEINSFEVLIEKLNISQIKNPNVYLSVEKFYQNFENDTKKQKYYYLLYDYKGIGVLIFKISPYKIEKLLIPLKKINIQNLHHNIM